MAACKHGSFIFVEEVKMTPEEYKRRHSNGEQGYEIDIEYLPKCPEPEPEPEENDYPGL